MDRRRPALPAQLLGYRGDLGETGGADRVAPPKDPTRWVHGRGSGRGAFFGEPSRGRSRLGEAHVLEVHQQEGGECVMELGDADVSSRELRGKEGTFRGQPGGREGT